jgi:hypothetical protein
MSLFNRPLGQRTMFNPIRYYQKRLEIKRNVFDADKNTLNLQELNRFVNGTDKRPRTAPTYLRAKTRDRLLLTVLQEWGDGKYANGLEGVAKRLTIWCRYPGGAENENVRGWLKLLANATPVECPADEPVKDRSQTSSREVINDGDDDAWSPIDAGPGTEDVGGSNKGSTTIDSNFPAEDVSKPVNVPQDVSNRVDPRGRRPLPMLRAKPDSTQPRPVVVHMVNGEVVPVKQ